MTLLRFAQSFHRWRALVVSNDQRGTASLAPTLQKLGLIVEQLPIQLDSEVCTPDDLSPKRDILFVDGDLNRPLAMTLTQGDLPPVPVVGLVGMEAPSRLRGLMQIGATAFLSKPVHGGAVFSALYLAVNEYTRRAELRNAIEEFEKRRRLRRHVIKAVTLYMKTHSIDDDAAFARLRGESMSLRMSVEAYCQYVVQRSATEPDRSYAAEIRKASAD